MNLKRIYNQNRNKIWKIILITAMVIFLIQLLNYFAKQKNKQENNEKVSASNNKVVISEKTVVENTTSKVTGEAVSSEKIKSSAETINRFVQYCNSGDIENAYLLLTDECKQILYPSVEDFKQDYYNDIFSKQRICEISNWIEDTYLIKLKEDILASGNAKDDDYIEDYYTVKTINGVEKININGFIENKKINKEVEKNGVLFTILSKDIFMDYQIYNFNVKNNSDNAIMIDPLTSTKTMYLQNEAGAKLYSYSHELFTEDMIVKSRYTKEYSIKFANSYGSSNPIKSLNFSKLILDYDSYNLLDDKSNYNNTYNFIIEL